MTFPNVLRFFTITLLIIQVADGNAQDRLDPVSHYNEAFSDQLLLYNGHEYIKFPEPYEGSPIFRDDLWNTGRVSYDGQVYDSIDLFYDTHRDLLVIEHFDQNGYPSYFYPPADRIGFFTVASSRFITLPEAVRVAHDLPSGYYQVMYEGNLSLLAKRRTGLYELQKDGKFVPVFKPEDIFYLRYQGAYHEIRNKSSVKKILRDFKKQINQFSRQRTLNYFKDQRENSLEQLVRYVDTLIGQGGTE